MSDDLSIPNSAYRMQQPRAGMDPALRRLMMYAGGLVAAGLVIGGVSMLFNRQSAGPVPVVSADPRPLRVKPENPGGMQIAGWRADRAADGDQPGKLAPGPEAPDPALLQAAPSTSPVEASDAGASRTAPPAAARTQTDAGSAASRPATPPAGAATGKAAPSSAPAKTPPAPTPVPTVTTVAPRTTTALAPPPGARPVPAPTPVAPAQAAAASAPQTGTLVVPAGKPAAPPPQQVAMGTLTPPAAKAAAPPAKPVSVQLAALLTEEAARAEWQQMERRMPEVLGSHTPSFSRFEREGRAYWRVRVSGFGDVQQAKSFCERVRAKSASCSVADF